MLDFLNNLFAKIFAQKEYSVKVNKFLSDNKLNSTEKKILHKLTEKYHLSKEDLLPTQVKAFNDTFNRLAVDERISEKEKEILIDLLDYFGLSIKEVHLNQKSLNKYYTLALIDSGYLPNINDHNLKTIFHPGEVLHWGCPATFNNQNLKGAFWLTNKRIGFTGEKEDLEFDYDQVETFKVTKTGLIITRKNDPENICFLLEDYDIPATIISHITK